MSRPQSPPPLGVTLHSEGADVAVFAAHADAVDLCLDDGAGGERSVPLTRRAHNIWWDTVAGIEAGQRYGFRVHGPWDPERGHRHNPAKLLLDPYGRALTSDVRWSPSVFGHRVGHDWAGDGDVRNTRDSADDVPRSVVVSHDYDWGVDPGPSVPWPDTVIYEAHVRGLTMLHPDVPEQLRGTYAALGHPAIIEHLTGLGVTTLELLPIHAFTSEPHLVQTGLTNYWGYNTLGFFAPHPGYAAAHDPQGVVEEVKTAIKTLHGADIEVILDVVYNHTCEQGADSGATLSWRGLDNASYYRLDERGRDIDVTGCGNTLDLRTPEVAAMVLDSLRHWVSEYRVDGFRFDLAPALARGRDDGYDPDHAFLVALRADPVLSRVKLIAEPWDVGMHGWRTGQFPPPFAEWNDRYRDATRTFWLADAARQRAGEQGHGIADLATRIAGSADLFGTGTQRPSASVNFVTSHDGFTLADTTRYERKHNEANGEDNRDGHDDNRSWNHGVEGDSDDPLLLDARRRSALNLMATLLTSVGVPMIAAGDEIGRSQRGNNNAYCQDNETSWLEWTLDDDATARLEATSALIALRRRHRVLRSPLVPQPGSVDGVVRLRWFDGSGAALEPRSWEDRSVRTVVALFDDAHDHPADPDVVAVVLHGDTAADHGEVTLPQVAELVGATMAWSSGDAVLTDGRLTTSALTCTVITRGADHADVQTGP